MNELRKSRKIEKKFNVEFFPKLKNLTPLSIHEGKYGN
jgi:hypothetical protein